MPRTIQPGFGYGNLPAEMRLLLRCMRWPATDEDQIAIRAFDASLIDWELFLALCNHHRVVPLVHRSLSKAGSQAPSETLTALKTAAAQNAVNTLRYLAETRRVCDLLQQAGVPVRVLKGVPLSQRLFADPSLRSVGDVDLLIAPGMEETADRILISDGFHRSEPAAPLTPRRRRSWRRHGKDYTYSDDRNGFEIDLHWRLFRNPYMPGNALADAGSAASERVQLGETALAVLPRDRSFLYLCVHGALDGWFRLKSLVDVAVFWRGFDDAQQKAVARLAQEHQVLPEMAAALHLAQYMHLLDDDALSAPMQLQASGREPRWIFDYTSTQHVAQRFQPTQDGVGSWPLKRYELGLRRGLAYRFEIVHRTMLRPRVWERFNLPDAFFPFYALLSPLEWVLFHRSATPASSPSVQSTAWRKWRGLSWERRGLLVEAFFALAVARSALVLLPVRRIFRWLEQPLRSGIGAADASAVAESVRWAVLTVARYGPLSFLCFPQALAAHALLRRRGISSIMHYGVRRAADRTMRAHTWLEVDHRMLLGGESAMLFAPIHSTGIPKE